MDAATAKQLATTGLDAPHWEALEHGEYRLPQCTECRRWIWPVEPRCGTCGSYEIGWEPAPLDGVVYSWTRTWYPFIAQRVASQPYVTVLVELPIGVRVLGIYVGDDERLRTGAAVVGAIAGPTEETFGLPSVVWS